MPLLTIHVLRDREWLSEGHRMAKTVTNLWSTAGMTGRTPLRVFAHGSHARTTSRSARSWPRVEDATITAAISGVLTLAQRWAATPPGSYNQNLWIDHPFVSAAYLPR